MVETQKTNVPIICEIELSIAVTGPISQTKITGRMPDKRFTFASCLCYDLTFIT